MKIQQLFLSLLLSLTSICIYADSSELTPFIAKNQNQEFPIALDWSQIPDIGYPKNEIVSIKIIQRELVETSNNISILKPSLWRIESDLWSVDYEGSIPYLENIITVGITNTTNISSILVTKTVQTEEGYYKDTSYDAFGLYQAINTPYKDSINEFILLNPNHKLAKIFQSKEPEEILELEIIPSRNTKDTESVILYETNIVITPRSVYRSKDPNNTNYIDTSVNKRNNVKTD